uniref:Uncharacterized protein n=1 Tax=Romanomermis culicivorax TaxID=13658 RepID=A0A915HQ73_ROMCU
MITSKYPIASQKSKSWERVAVKFDIFVGHSLKTIKKNVYHNDRLARDFALKILTALIPPNTNAAQFKRKNDKYCPPTNMEDKPAEPIDFQAFIKAENLYNEFLEMATKIFTSHHDMVLQCSWKGLNFPCNAPSSPTMLSASYTDDGLCFMFQHDPEWVQKKSTEINLSWRKSFIKSRPHELSLIFDLKQYQRCGYCCPYVGEGFSITAFDRRTLAQTNMLQSSSFRIQPGYEYKLGIKTVINDRLTEHLNRCRSKGYTPTDGGAELLAYTKGTCQGIVLLNFVVQKCNCLPPIPKWFAPYANKENTGLNIEALKLCSDSMAGLDCLLKYLLKGPYSVLGADDRHCMDPCVEPTYKFFMHAKNKLTEIYLRNFNVPLKNAKNKDLPVKILHILAYIWPQFNYMVVQSPDNREIG